MSQGWSVVQVAHQVQRVVCTLLLRVVKGMSVSCIESPSVFSYFDASDGWDRGRNRISIGFGSESNHVCTDQKNVSLHVHWALFNSIAKSKLHGTKIGEILHKITTVVVCEGCQICLRLIWLCMSITWGALYADESTSVCAHMYILVQSISNRGCPYIHMSVAEGQNRVLLKFLTDLIYCDSILLSSVICSIGDRAPVDIACITKCSASSLLKLSLTPRLRHNHRFWANTAPIFPEHFSPRCLDFKDSFLEYARDLNAKMGSAVMYCLWLVVYDSSYRHALVPSLILYGCDAGYCTWWHLVSWYVL